jgi:hypothetical protein
MNFSFESKPGIDDKVKTPFGHGTIAEISIVKVEGSPNRIWVRVMQDSGALVWWQPHLMETL